MLDPLSAPSRRQVLVAAAVTASVPLLDSALNTLPAAHAAAPAPATPAATSDAWTATTLKASDLKDNEFTPAGIDGIVLARVGKTVAALSTVCTHKGCTVAARGGAKILACPCHGAQFHLDGTAAKAPAQKPLAHYAIRVNDKGMIEVDKTQQVARGDKSATITLS
jgi:cytochrome b6-f complex iron-sulfur subunit